MSYQWLAFNSGDTRALIMWWEVYLQLKNCDFRIYSYLIVFSIRVTSDAASGQFSICRKGKKKEKGFGNEKKPLGSNSNHFSFVFFDVFFWRKSQSGMSRSNLYEFFIENTSSASLTISEDESCRVLIRWSSSNRDVF